jgi:CO dehydrogenase maturation factor
MKLGIVGKGGAGKTSICALLSQLAAVQGRRVLAIDADINQHLAVALGLLRSDLKTLRSLGTEFERLKEYVRGQNSRIISPKEIIKTTPPGRGSRFLTLDERDPFVSQCATEVGGVRLLVAGEFEVADVGTRCYHGKVGGVELLLNHLIDESDDFVAVDMTAGADAFASGIFTRFDMLLLVCKPTRRSLAVFEQFVAYAERFGIAIRVIANKIRSEDEIAFVREVTGDSFIAGLWHSEHLRSLEQDGHTRLDGLEPQNVTALRQVIDVAASIPRDWKRYYEQAIHFHIENAKSWGNAAIGRDLTTQIDPAIVSMRLSEDLSAAH